MLFIIAASLLFSIVLIGYGSLLYSKLDFLKTFIFGNLVVLSLLTTLHFFVAISTLLSIVITTVGVMLATQYFVHHQTRLVRQLQKLKKLTPVEYLAIFIVVILLAGYALKSTAPASAYDTLLYHWPMTQWNMEQRLPQGLAWIHTRFGFNDLNFLMTSYFSSLFASPRLTATYNVVLLSVFTIFAIHQLLQKKSWWAMLALILFFFSRYQLYALNSLIPELPLFIFSLFTLHFYQQKDAELSAVSAVLALMMKVSGLFLIVFPLILVARRFPIRKKVTALVVVSLLLFLTRSVWISGYLFYPVAQTRLPLNYSLPTATAERERDIIHNWARWGTVDRRSGSLLTLASLRFRSLPLLQQIGLLFVPVGIGIFLHRKKYNSAVTLVILTVLLVVNFIQAPDARLLWPALLTLLVFALSFGMYQLKKPIAANIAIAMVLLLLMSFYEGIMNGSSLLQMRNVRLQPYPVFGADFRFQRDALIPFSFTTPSPGSDQCGYARHPCLTYPAASARLNFVMNQNGSIRSVNGSHETTSNW